ncbi:YjbF family lipoprotein [Litoribacillus peritrichatus]|uniref:YjbF family lipoprotein n=1 Tax=Litoribacillus peritrichatus TaxID=718191 RepID=A0ABP7M6Z4_9GAMM
MLRNIGWPTFFLCMFVMLTGCTQNSAMGVVGKSLEVAFYGHPDAKFDREYIESIPYATMILKIGMGPKSLVVHSKTVNNDIHWIAADYTLYVTRNGRIVKTVNLPINRVGLESRAPDPITQIEQGKAWDYDYYYEVDLQPGNFFATPIRSKFFFDGEEVLDIMGEKVLTKRYVEVFSSKKLYWEDKNYFWFDAKTNKLKQSLQFIDPKTPAFLTQVTR